MTRPIPLREARFGRRVVVGISVALSSYAVTRALNLVVTILLARMLAPEGMGVIAAALLLVELIDTWRDFGLRDALIYEPEGDPVVSSTAFALILAVAGAQALTLLALAPFATVVVDDQAIVGLLMVLALLFPINALGAVPDALLQKRLQMFRRGITDVVGAIVKLAATVYLLQEGFGIWSMALGVLLAATARTTMLVGLVRWWPGTAPSLATAWRLLAYGKHIVSINILAPLRTRLDQFAITLAMSDAALGLYFIAARIPELVIYGVNVIITRVVFPAFVTIADDGAALQRAYLATTKWCLVLIAPVAIGLAATASIVVPLLFGPEWASAAPVLALLALAGIPLTLGWSAGDVFKATGRPHLLNAVVVLEMAVTGPLVWIAAIAFRNVTAVAAAMLVGEILSAGLRLAFMKRRAQVSVVETLRAVWPPIAAALAMGTVVTLAAAEMGGGWLDLAGLVALGVLAYGAALAVLDGRDLGDGLRQIMAARS